MTALLVEGVPGFPELIALEPRCHVCQLVQSHSGLVKLVHRYRRDEGLGAEMLEQRMKPIFERHGVTPLAGKSMTRHLLNHVDFDRVPKDGAVDTFGLPDATELSIDRLATDAAALRAGNLDDLATGANDSDYHQMADLFRRLVRRVRAMDGDPTAFVTPDGQPSVQRLTVWANMVTSAKSIIEGLNKMRNSDRMVASILEAHTKRYALAVAQPLAASIRDVRDALSHHHDPVVRAQADRLSALLDNDVSDIFTQAALRSLRESKEQYKLLN